MGNIRKIGKSSFDISHLSDADRKKFDLFLFAQKEINNIDNEIKVLKRAHAFHLKRVESEILSSKSGINLLDE